ncbi:hypothetical protein EV385_3683 [Krasilnikovia cinnamomea]|uniref:Uncharacterized protein n=1 Tax=Krasilnikovia cinnamomea TaxID=349313 RepID=A0A4Q7ZLL4_9ACTN|nr:hypothetical protein [Krasilnikovia cinnamomea]RZU51847.1 hypothetical protein EV385_3683 [Krasilnikovia cinnamomea]
MTEPLDPTAVLADFIDRVAHFDPAPDAAPVAVLGVRTALGEGTFAVGDHVVRAMCRALASYRDPADHGTCSQCGSRRLDENLHCRECGQLHGILGEVIARHALRVAQEATVADPTATDPGKAAAMDAQTVDASTVDASTVGEPRP